MQQKPNEFTVKDKRLFNPDGTAREEKDSSGEPVGAGSPRPPQNEKENKKGEETSPLQEDQPHLKNEAFEINFSTFILSLASSVQFSLGLIPHPATQKPEVNLVGAKQTIDILEMMRTKTKGNLDRNEEMLLNQVIYELQMMYVEVQKKHA